MGDPGFPSTVRRAVPRVVLGRKLKAVAAAQIPRTTPHQPRIRGPHPTEFVGPLSRRDGVLTARNAVVVSPGRLDRSPCGTGTSARLAVLHAKKQIDIGETVVHESVIGGLETIRITTRTCAASRR